MATFKVKGGIKLKGDLHPQGAKNEALQVLCAVAKDFFKTLEDKNVFTKKTVPNRQRGAPPIFH